MAATTSTRRAKSSTAPSGTGSASPERAGDLELRRHQRESAQSHIVFVPSAVLRYRRPAFARRVERAAIAGLGIKVSHVAHACGYKLANGGHDTRAIQAYPGHRNIQNTSATPPWRRSG